MSALYEKCRDEILAHRTRQEELAHHAEELLEECKSERAGREQTEAELDRLQRELEDALRRHRRALEDKESALRNALSDLARAQALLGQREADLAAIHNTMKKLESESKKAGEVHTTDRFSLELELDRLKRDVSRLEDELSRARKDLDDKDDKLRDKESLLDKLHTENRDLSAQASAQTQARLNVSEKLDGVQANLRVADADAASFRARVNDLESRLSKDQRALLNTEQQYRDQLTERNTLLLTIYQYMDKILGVDKTPVRKLLYLGKAFVLIMIQRRRMVKRRPSLSRTSPSFMTISSQDSSPYLKFNSTSTSGAKRLRADLQRSWER
jgi:chromosome segregation ATPase